MARRSTPVRSLAYSGYRCDRTRQCEVKRGATGGAGRGPNPPLMCRNDGAANSESESQTASFGREKRLENSLQLLMFDASTAVEDRGTNECTSLVQNGHDLNPSILGGIGVHRFTGVENQRSEEHTSELQSRSDL